MKVPIAKPLKSVVGTFFMTKLAKLTKYASIYKYAYLWTNKSVIDAELADFL